MNNPARETKECLPSPEMSIHFRHHNSWAATGSNNELVASVLEEIGLNDV
jgi:hypothetical protein